MALHAKAKAEAGYRFYALYDKISREDILAHAYAQCRSNKGAPGVDGQNFADIDAYGVQRWLGELALALRQESYRPIGESARNHKAGGQVESHVARMGELLRSRHRLKSVPGDRQLHGGAVAPVVTLQA